MALGASPKAAANDGFDPFWLWRDVTLQAARLLAPIIAGKPLEDQETALAQLDGLVALVEFLTEQDTDVGIFELMQIDMSSYVVAHHVQTVFLCGLIANKLGLPEARRHSLCRAALTMNVAVLELQEALSRQLTPISPEQKREMTGHGKRSRQLLEAYGITDPDWLRAVEEHHPEVLPTGYMASDLAKIIHHADVYLAKISPRAYRPAKVADLAARELIMSPSADRRIVSILIKEFGVYPPGSYVSLANGETAIVVRRGVKAHAPLVYSLAIGNTTFEKPIARLTESDAYAITSIVNRKHVQFVVNRANLLGYHHV